VDVVCKSVLSKTGSIVQMCSDCLFAEKHGLKILKNFLSSKVPHRYCSRRGYA
jgi:hypothetical protein